eukprot:CAMPEP_0173381272 /NCGR_PEP_ID=MMETSP1356-20130122/3675_1 /TAXON_ID=77927 ORGANISM="Hemiselmis virescens, Strain PCC157" /NCGR_SAMPLE_ID=MMETSP1356 /ASSEMBLY_ACC=CAM_ASM_000847 /LENGTH=226 /DNA_ID=CAMNT_0014335035 /DNA_START=114 /DNA_END=794 /DNA_ORIENTATION=+
MLGRGVASTAFGSVHSLRAARDFAAPAVAQAAAGKRWMASAQGDEASGKSGQGAAAGPPLSAKAAEALDPASVINKSQEVADQVKALGRRSFYQWYHDHQDEVLVVFFASLLFLSTLRLFRVKGERLDDQKEHEEKVAELEEAIERLKTDIRASVEAGAVDAASKAGVWTSKVPVLRAEMLKLVNAGIKNATKAPVEEKPSDEPTDFALLAAEHQQQPPARAKGII